MQHIIRKAMSILGSCALALGISVQGSSTPKLDFAPLSQYQTKAQGLTKGWKKAGGSTSLSSRIPGSKPRQKTVASPDIQLPKADSFGVLYLPDEREWSYTADYNYLDEYHTMFDSATFTIFDENLNQMGKFTASFALGEGEVGVNYVAINPNVTRKFFHYNEAYEFMVFVHVVTEDFTGKYYTQVFSLGTPEPILTMDGNQVLMTNMASDSWTEDYIMIFLNEKITITESEDNDYADYTYMQYYNVYKKCGWGTDGPQLLHTFEINYESIVGSGENMLPVIPVKHNGKIFYVLPHYEKPYFDQSVPVTEEPVVNPDNTFIIDLYNDQFEIVKTTRIPMHLFEGYIYSFPEMGGFMYTNDVVFDKYVKGDLPAYIVTYENYNTSSDDYESAYWVYDTDGNVVDIIGEEVSDCLLLSDIPGCEPQMCFYKEAEEAFWMVDVYSCEMVAEIPIVYDGMLLSSTIDRLPASKGYQYAVALVNGEIAEDGETVMHRVAFFNTDSELMNYDRILMSKDVVMALPYIDCRALDPYFFNTDDKREYMMLVKELDDYSSSKSTERLYLINTDGERLLVFEPDADKGILASIWLQNVERSNPMIVAVYRDDDWHFTMTYTKLPLESKLAGAGTQADPYQISTAGDLKLIDNAPNAYYTIVNDLDFAGSVWRGLNQPFTGVLDGQGHAMFNLLLNGSGLFPEVQATAVVKDFDIVNPVIVPGSVDCGIIAASTVYSGGDSPVISGIKVFSPVVESESFSCSFGGIAGDISTSTVVTDCGIFDANINLPNAEVGGIAVRQLSGATVKNCYVSGKLVGKSVGGIVADSSTGTLSVSNCHVDADLTGLRNVGGIIGYMGQERGYRPSVQNCYVEGTITSTASDDPSVGGIAGYLSQPIYTDVENSIHECVVAVKSINFNADAAVKSAHRIVGHTVDVDKVIDWDNVKDDMEPSDYPTLNVQEQNISNNYAVGIARIDETFADELNSIEGLTIEAAQLTQAKYTELGFAFGDNADKPWQITGTGIGLYFEDAVAPEPPTPPVVDSIESIVVDNAIAYDGLQVQAQGCDIAIYAINGTKVAQGHDAVSTLSLSRGVYIVVAQNATAKYATKIAVK